MSSDLPELGPPVFGHVAAEVAEEFPALRLAWLDVAVRPGPSPPEVRERLRGLSDRFRGSTAVAMRQQAIPWAYRVFYRHIGLDPDADRTPLEALALERLMHGGYRSKNLVDDALTITLAETGVPVWALDLDRLQGPLELRLSGREERLGRNEDAAAVRSSRLVVADELGPLALVFGTPASGHGLRAQSEWARLYAIQVAGVPLIHVEEALWSCSEVLSLR